MPGPESRRPRSRPSSTPASSASPASQSPTSAFHRDREIAERNWLPWIVAAVVIAVLAGLALFFGGRQAPTGPPSAANPYADRIAINNVTVSRASNFAGDQLTYVDGTVANHGDRTVTAIVVRVRFASLDGEQPQIEEVPLTLIRARQPYVDTEPISAAPLKPGSSQDFRLIFDNVSPEWDQQAPNLTPQSIQTRP